jgi:hypothetical protein
VANRIAGAAERSDRRPVPKIRYLTVNTSP